MFGLLELEMNMNRPPSVIVTSMAAALTTCGFAYGADLTPAPVYRSAPIMYHCSSVGTISASCCERITTFGNRISDTNNNTASLQH